MRPIILLSGVTASGKSALAIRLAQLLKGVIVNCDSMQVYSDLRVLTARPSIEEESQAPHKLFGFVDGAENYNVGSYIKKLESLLKVTTEPLILCGGTGLYFRSLTQGLSTLPPTQEKTRLKIRQETEGLETPQIFDILKQKDKDCALNPNDTLRILRALEVFEETGLSITEWQKRNPPKPLLTNTQNFFLSPPRQEVYTKINARYVEMLEMGALDEVKALKNRQLDPFLPVMRAHGVPSLIKYLNNEMTLEEAISIGQQDTRNYAKRQWTWFRGQMKDYVELDPKNAYESITNAL